MIMQARLLILCVLLTVFSCSIDKKEDALYDPVLIYKDLSVEKLEKNGFERISENSNTFYLNKDNFREIRYEIIDDEVVSRIFKIKYKDLQKFLRKYKGEIVEQANKNDVLKLNVRGIEVLGILVKEKDDLFMEITTDYFHRIICN